MSETAAPEVLVRVDGAVGRLTLNRPSALNALTLNMCQIMIRALMAWRSDSSVAFVIIDHAGERGFCAGGDIRMLAESGAGDGAKARAFLFNEYRLNHLLFVYEKPVVAIMDGVTMGGGVGITAPARYRVATERLTYAMPETGIGLFPDVGGGWFLPRLPGKAGFWLGLTGARLKAADSLALGIATDFVSASDVEALKAALVAAGGQGDADAAISAVLADFAEDPGPSPLAAHRADLDRLFTGDSIEAISEALQADPGEWAQSQLKTLNAKSPQSLKVTFRQLTAGAALSRFADNMTMEYRICTRAVHRPDFLEGVRAVIIDKDNAPRWSPATLSEVPSTVIDDLFAPYPPAEEWTPLPELSA
jgi:enoyl-CoA hydratase